MNIYRTRSRFYLVLFFYTIPSITIDAIKIFGIHDTSLIYPLFKEVTSILPWSLGTDSSFVYHKQIDIFLDLQVGIVRQSSLRYNPLETDGQ